MTREEVQAELTRLCNERKTVWEEKHKADEAVRLNADAIQRMQNKLIDLEIEAAT